MNAPNTLQLIAKLKREQVHLLLEGADQLRLVGRANRLSANLLDEIKSHKPELVNFLRMHKVKPVASSDELTPEPSKEPQYYATDFAQQKEYTLFRLKADRNFFNLQFLLEVGTIAEAVLAKLLQTILNRHEALRTSFALVDGTLQQVIHPAESVNVSLRYVDLTTELNQALVMEQVGRQENETPFDFHQAPLWRIVGFRRPGHQQSFLFTFHHVIADHTSLRLLREELIALYKAEVAEQANPLKPVQAQYKEYTLRKNQLIHSEPLRAFWTKQLAHGFTPLTVVRPEAMQQQKQARNQLFNAVKQAFGQLELRDSKCLIEVIDRMETPEGGSIHYLVDKPLLNDLEAVGAQYNVSLFGLLAAGMGLLFYQLGNQQRLTYTFPIVARQEELFQHTFGWLTGSAICFSTIDDETETVASYVQRVNESIVQSLSYSDYPFHMLYDELGISSEQWVPLAINYLGFDGEPVPANFLDVPLQSNGSIAYHDLSVNFGHYADGLTLTAYFKTSLFEVNEALRIIHTYGDVLKRLVSQPHAVLHSFKKV